MRDLDYGMQYRRHQGQASRAAYDLLHGKRLTDAQARAEVDSLLSGPKPLWTGYQELQDDGTWKAIPESTMTLLLERNGSDVDANTARMQAGGVMRMRSTGRKYRWIDEKS